MKNPTDYFAQVAGQWDEIRAGYFSEHMRDAAIAKVNLPPNAVVADIGTGTGFVAMGLAPKVAKVFGFDANGAKLTLRECGPDEILCNPERVLSVIRAVSSVPKSEFCGIAFDVSAEMLDVARRNLAAFPNVELRQSPGDHLPLPDDTLNAAFANMYLHHAPDPAGAIKELARTLKPGGALCITDLDTHDHEWQREQMADLWLGFERDDIRRWFTEAELKDIDVDCAEGTCNACGPDGTVKPLSIFVAIGRKA